MSAAERLSCGGPRSGLSSIRAVGASRAVAAATAVAAVAWAASADLRESLFLDRRQDLGHFTQAVWSTAHGHFMQVTEAGGMEVSRLGIHVDPIIAVFAPLWWIWPSPQLLLTVQAMALAAGALPLFWLGRKHLPRERDAALLAGAYLLCPYVGWNAVSDFHAVALAVPFLLLSIWWLDEGRLLLFAAAVGAAMLCQEQIGLLVGCLGLWHAWRSRQLRVGLIVAAAGLAVSSVDFLVVLRHFSGGSPFGMRFGGSPTGLALDLFTQPLTLVRQINAGDLKGLLVALPVLGSCFGSTILLAAMPQVALLLLSRRSNDWFGINVLVVIPFVYTASVFTVARLAKASGNRQPRLVAGSVFAASVVAGLAIGPFSILGTTRALFPRHAPVAPQRQALGFIPADARVSATSHLALALSARRYVYLFPIVKLADWVVVDSRDDTLPNMSYLRRRTGINVGEKELYRQPALMHSELHLLRQSPEWRLVFESDRIYVFTRRHA